MIVLPRSRRRVFYREHIHPHGLWCARPRSVIDDVELFWSQSGEEYGLIVADPVGVYSIISGATGLMFDSSSI